MVPLAIFLFFHICSVYATVNISSIEPSTIGILGHEFTGWTPARVTVCALVSIMTWVLSEAIPMAFELLFKVILKWHLEYHPITALTSLLVFQLGFSIQLARDIIRQYHAEYNTDDISYYATLELSETYKSLKASRRLFYRTNFFELFYIFVRFAVVLTGNMVGAYILQYDFIAFIQSNLINSILILYGLMSFIQGIISEILLLFKDDHRIGDIVFIPAYNLTGCIMEFGSFQVKLGTLNFTLLQRIMKTMESGDDRTGVNNSTHNSSSRETYSHIGSTIESLIPKTRHSSMGVINSQFVSEVDSSLHIPRGTFSPQGPLSSGIILPLPPSPSSPVGSSSGNGDQTPHYGVSKKLLVSHTTGQHQPSGYRSLLISSYVPNTTFWQTNINNLSC